MCSAMKKTPIVGDCTPDWIQGSAPGDKYRSMKLWRHVNTARGDRVIQEHLRNDAR